MLEIILTDITISADISASSVLTLMLLAPSHRFVMFKVQKLYFQILYCRKNEKAFHYIINRTYYLPVNIHQFIRLPLCIGENVDFCD